METTRTGGCRCGDIRLTTSGEPVGTFKCYCTDCLKLGGGNPTIAAIYPADAVKVSTGEPQGHAVPADSGASVTRYFCPGCGTPLHAASSGHPDVVFVKFGVFDEPPAFEVTREIWTDSAPPWHHLAPASDAE